MSYERVYFQDLHSYHQGVRWNAAVNPRPAVEEAVVRALDASQSSGVCDYEHMLNERLRCSLRRRRVELSERLKASDSESENESS